MVVLTSNGNQSRDKNGGVVFLFRGEKKIKM